MEKHNRRKQICRDYLKARQNFLQIANEDEILKGNDNIIGRIGEFIAFQFLENTDRNPEMNLNPVQKGYDIICDQEVKVSVKMITHENKGGQTTQICEPWQEVLVISLNEKIEVEKIGHLTKEQFLNALNETNRWSKTPYTRKTMLNSNGLIGKYGKVYQSKDLQHLDLI
jgi:hypothetical protein